MYLPYSIECLNNTQFYQTGISVLKIDPNEVDKEILSLLSKTSLVKSFNKWANKENINKYDAVYKNATPEVKMQIIKEIIHKYFRDILL